MSTITAPPYDERPQLRLSSESGNAFRVVGMGCSTLVDAGLGRHSPAFVEAVMGSGSEHLLDTCQTWFEVS
jgi:hypothetical protein